MKWYYAEGTTQKGPVEDKELAGLFQSGTIMDSTLVWREGMSGWQPFSAVREDILPPSPASGMPPIPPATGVTPASQTATPGNKPGGGVVCSECQGTFNLDQVVKIDDRFVCSACKPSVLQRIKEGLPSNGAVSDPGIIVERVLARGFQVDAGKWIRGGWDDAKQNLGGKVLAVFVMQLANMAMSQIPCLGPLASLFLSGPLSAGLFWYFILHARGEDPRFGEVFAGFKRNFQNLMIQSIIVSLVVGACFIPAAMLFGVGIAIQSNSSSSSPLALILVAGILGLVTFFLVVFLSICWGFSLPLIIDKMLHWKAGLTVSYRIVKTQFWSFFGFYLLLGLIFFGIFAVMGVAFVIIMAVTGSFGNSESISPIAVVLLVIGGLVAVPIFLGMGTFMMSVLVRAYEDIFGEKVG